MDCCDYKRSKHSKDCVYRYALYIVLGINLAMFFTEVTFSFLSGSVALLADAMDFLGDSANYIISLFVLSRSIKIRAKASLIKGVSMLMFGIYVIFKAVENAAQGVVPDYNIMSIIGLTALFANLSAVYVLFKFREGDSNMRSVWLCSRNDAIGNIAVVLAAIAVYFFKSAWPDLLVASLMAFLAITSALEIIKKAKLELRHRR